MVSAFRAKSVIMERSLVSLHRSVRAFAMMGSYALKEANLLEKSHVPNGIQRSIVLMDIKSIARLTVTRLRRLRTTPDVLAVRNVLWTMRVTGACG